MKSIAFNLKKTGFSIAVFACICFSARAQKTENVQAESVWAPTVRVDGKSGEWIGPLKAVNKDTHLSYTMANDATNLYLVIQSSEAANNSKIMLGGISLTINPDDKKRIKDGYTITFPVINRAAGRGGAQGGRGQGGQGAAPGARTQVQSAQMSQHQRDSMQTVQARAQLAAAKEIKVHGFKNITDSLISIYNEYALQVSATIDEKGVFVYELAIPLESLEMSADRPKEFSYNIKINGLQFGGPGGEGKIVSFGNAPVSFGAAGAGGRAGGGAGARGATNVSASAEDRMAMMSPTEFWGKYTLTKK